MAEKVFPSLGLALVTSSKLLNGLPAAPMRMSRSVRISRPAATPHSSATRDRRAPETTMPAACSVAMSISRGNSRI